MRSALLAIFIPLSGMFFGCGGTVGKDLDPTAEPPVDSGVETSVDGSPRDTGIAPPDSVSDSGAETADTTAADTWIEPECPDAGPAKKDFKCDPLAATSGCPKGQTCYPFVDYSEDRCVPETYRARCFPAGTGKPGDPCGGGGDRMCAAGMACVVSGSGTTCATMCAPGKPGTCEDGLVCEPVDVPGLGVCI